MNPGKFRGLTPLALAKEVTEHDFRFPIPETCPEVIQKLIGQCWAAHGTRPVFADVIKELKLHE